MSLPQLSKIAVTFMGHIWLTNRGGAICFQRLENN
jgi:hypothetical protein